MARFRVPSGLRGRTGGLAEFDVAAVNYREAVRLIVARFPAFSEKDLLNCSVAIDGEIFPRPLLATLKPDSEVVLLGRMFAG